MKNKDVYKEEIFEIATSGDRVAIVNDKPVGCITIDCKICDFYSLNSGCGGRDKCKQWMNKDCADWANVPVDTKIFVKGEEDDRWRPRYFAKYENGIVYSWSGGSTSWSAEGITCPWTYAKLAESEE